MIDFAKIYCKSHPYESVTNFCKKDSCLIGLCATCVCTHTEWHAKQHTTPDYQNIRDTFIEVHRKVRENISALEDDKERISILNTSIEKRRLAIKQAITETRRACVELVNDHFDKYTKEVQQIVASENQKNGFHSSYRLETLSASLTKEITSLINCSQELNTTSFLDSAKRIQRYVLSNTKKLHDAVVEELFDNEQYEPFVQSNENVFEDLRGYLNRLMSVHFEYPRPQINEGHFRSSSANSSNLCDLATEKSIEERNSPSEENTRMHNFLREEILYNDSCVTFNHLPHRNKSEIVAKRIADLTSRIYQSQQIAPIMPRSNSSIVIQRGFPASRNPFIYSQSPMSKPSAVCASKPYFISEPVRPSSLRKSNTTFNSQNVSQLLPQNSRVLQQENLNQAKYANKISFVPKYIDIENEPSNPIKRIEEVKKRSSSKKGIKLCTTSEILSQESKENFSVASSLCNSSIQGTADGRRLRL